MLLCSITNPPVGKRRLIVGCCFLCVAVASISATPLRADLYELVGPPDAVQAKIEASPQRLVVIQSDGKRVVYLRSGRHDTWDQRYFGYANTSLARILRFPASGFGGVHVAKLGRLIPQFSFSGYSVRPVRQAVGFVPQALLGSVFIPPQIFPDPVFDPFISPFPVFRPGDLLVPAPPQPQAVVLQTRTIDRPPLSPARVSLRNSGPRELLVTILDQLQPQRDRQLRIGPGLATSIQLERDAGQTIVKKVQTFDAVGNQIIQDVKQEVEPAPRYEVVVHEVRLQSIAIDRTPGGNNAIQDINQTGIGLGRFALPPGPELNSGTIDVFAAARSRQNAGTVAPILASEDEPSRLDPLERVLLQLRNRPPGELTPGDR